MCRTKIKGCKVETNLNLVPKEPDGIYVELHEELEKFESYLHKMIMEKESYHTISDLSNTIENIVDTYRKNKCSRNNIYNSIRLESYGVSTDFNLISHVNLIIYITETQLNNKNNHIRLYKDLVIDLTDMKTPIIVCTKNIKTSITSLEGVIEYSQDVILKAENEINCLVAYLEHELRSVESIEISNERDLITILGEWVSVYDSQNPPHPDNTRRFKLLNGRKKLNPWSIKTLYTRKEPISLEANYIDRITLVPAIVLFHIKIIIEEFSYQDLTED